MSTLNASGSGAVPERGFPLSRSTSKPLIVAVDGPAGSGKSSICSKVAERIGWTYINTGALYRAVGLLAMRANLDLEDQVAVAYLVDDIANDLRWCDKERALWYRGENLTPLLASEEAGLAASKIAKLALVRQRLLPVQKALTLAAPIGALVDGRDIGTVVFPDADLKIFLTASLNERAKRRLAQLGKNLNSIDDQELTEVMQAVASRDERDAARSEAPLKQAAEAQVVDTSLLDVEQTITSIIDLMRQKGLLS